MREYGYRSDYITMLDDITRCSFHDPRDIMLSFAQTIGNANCD
jgi:hypothetical protein